MRETVHEMRTGETGRRIRAYLDWAERRGLTTVYVWPERKAGNTWPNVARQLAREYGRNLETVNPEDYR